MQNQKRHTVEEKQSRIFSLKSNSEPKELKNKEIKTVQSFCCERATHIG